MTTKSRVLFLLRYLFENTDDEHSISTNDLIAALQENGFSAARKTLRDDVAMLVDTHRVQSSSACPRRYGSCIGL